MISDCIYNYDYQQFVWKLLLKVLCVVLSDIAVVLLTYNYGCDSQLPLVVYSILVSFVKHSAILDFCQESLEKKTQQNGLLIFGWRRSILRLYFGKVVAGSLDAKAEDNRNCC